MKTKILLTSGLLVLTLLTGACGGQAGAAGPEDDSITADGGVTDLASLTEALRAAGATIEPAEGVSQPFFSVPGEIMLVNGGFVQVYEYETAEAMGTEASQISEDGSTIGTSMVNWMEAPHFYRAGRMIVLYVGEDPAVLDLLEAVLGTQFAGR